MLEPLSCPNCGQEKPDDDFPPAPRNTGRRGRASWCRVCGSTKSREWKAAHPRSQVTQRQYNRLYRRRKRAAALAVLGGCCSGCGIDDERLLDIDHIDGDGRIERLTLGSYAILGRVLSGSSGYQLLCANCHRIKTLEAGEHLAKQLPA